MSNASSLILPGAKLSQGYLERLLGSVTQENYARFARPGDVVVTSNHPAFVLGHLSLYPARIMQFLNQPPGATTVPAGYDPLFKAGAECRDDTDGKIYPPLSELKSACFGGYKAAIAAIDASGDEVYSRPNPVEGRSRELFPTIGAAINFYLTGHVQNHAGQISTWRRCMGMPAAT